MIDRTDFSTRKMTQIGWQSARICWPFSALSRSFVCSECMASSAGSIAKITTLFFIFSLLSACHPRENYQGTKADASFFETYSGSYLDADSEKMLTITSDGQFRMTYMTTRAADTRSHETGNVSDNQSTLPNCAYAVEGHILQILERSANGRNSYESGATHIVQVEYMQIDNLDASGSGNGVPKSCRPRSAQIEHRLHNYYASFPDHQTIILKTFAYVDYVNSQPRGVLLRNETFIRIPQETL